MFKTLPFDFSGRTALVTGAGRGIGKGIAEALVQAGATVHAISKNESNLQLLQQRHPSIIIHPCDLSDWEQTREIVDSIPTIDCLVNCAAVLQVATFQACKPQDFDSMYNTNLKAVLNVSQVVVKKLREAGKPGSIVNISAVAGIKPYSSLCGYAALKAALDHLTRNMAQELGPFNIRVNSLNPGPVVTDMLRNASAAMSEMSGENLEEIQRKAFQKIPLPKKVADIYEIVNTTLFLLSDAAPMIHGAVIPIDGGISVAM